ncbi:hypothetical protein ACJIZ3_014717 [Penstemon smallii]|uniref:C2H2-type domain-containing protein n=1 Tax=Penstemon smallii TaxID=265156 RepID=A0ABD3RL50_9LAMI
MEEVVQEQRFYICKICNRSCVSGKSLGGHMRGHLALIYASKKAEENQLKSIETDQIQNFTKNQSNSNFLSEEKIKGSGDSDENNSYELRENPKKSWRMSDSKRVVSENGVSSCKQCGKEFPTIRALSGHMRWHSSKVHNSKGVHQCKECGKGFDSMRAMFGHMKTHSKKLKAPDESDDTVSNLFPIRRKRSRISIPNPCLDESDSEVMKVEVAATCLMMLSRGVSDWNRFNSVTESSGDDDDSTYFGDESSCKMSKISPHDRVSGSLFDDFAFSIADKNKMNIDTGISDDKLLLSIDNRIKQESGGVGVLSLETSKSKERECPICFKLFSSGQALGGHKRVHYTKEALSVQVNQESTFYLNFPVTDQVTKGLNLWWIESGLEDEEVPMLNN